jgi:hypothetical protein
MMQAGKIILILGVILIVIGGALYGLGKLGFRGLPGDIRYESERTRIYFPIVTCLILSAVLTAAMWLWRWLNQK